MNKKVIVILLVIFFVKHAVAQSSTFSLKTNLLSWAVLAPNIQMEYGFAKHISLILGGSYGWWGFTGRQNAIENWNIGAGVHYYFSRNKPFTRHHLGVAGQVGQFDIKWGKTGKRGEYQTIGLVYGYTWQIVPRFLIDATIGAGYILTDYTKYQWHSRTNCFVRLEDVLNKTPGLTGLTVSFIYRFPLKK